MDHARPGPGDAEASIAENASDHRLSDGSLFDPGKGYLLYVTGNPPRFVDQTIRRDDDLGGPLTDHHDEEDKNADDHWAEQDK